MLYDFGADGILIPERDEFDEQDLIDTILRNRSKGKTHHVIINAEGVGHTDRLARRIEAATGIETRATILGHIQRGGVPNARDRVNATKMGYMAVELLLAGKTNRIVCTHDGGFTDVDMDEGLEMKKGIQTMEVDVLAAMTGI